MSLFCASMCGIVILILIVAVVVVFEMLIVVLVLVRCRPRADIWQLLSDCCTWCCSPKSTSRRRLYSAGGASRNSKF